MVATVDLTPLNTFPVDEAMFVDLHSRWIAAPETTIADSSSARVLFPPRPSRRCPTARGLLIDADKMKSAAAECRRPSINTPGPILLFVGRVVPNKCQHELK